MVFLCCGGLAMAKPLSNGAVLAFLLGVLELE